ncbi:MAG: hypothetical protein KHX26_01405 [Burkholderiales bacterium]|nr:hypothetical protein [Burkholderiales bacterium]
MKATQFNAFGYLESSEETNEYLMYCVKKDIEEGKEDKLLDAALLQAQKKYGIAKTQKIIGSLYLECMTKLKQANERNEAL